MRISDWSSTCALPIYNLSINNQRSKRAEVAAELAGMLAKFEPDYPPAKALKAQPAALDASIAREERRAVSAVQSTYAAALALETGLRPRVASQIGRASCGERVRQHV